MNLDPKDTTGFTRGLIAICHGLACDSGWWTDVNSRQDLRGKKNVPTLLMLIVSELAEAMEGHRKDLKDEHLPEFKSIEVELADALIRICDMAGGMGYNLPGAVAAKLEYNKSRADHKLDNRAKQNGKKY